MVYLNCDFTLQIRAPDCFIAFIAALYVAVQNHMSIVDDQFFKLSEMEHFLEHEDQRYAGKHDGSDDSVDLFQPSGDDADEVCVWVHLRQNIYSKHS
jgi:hypothetical protein